MELVAASLRTSTPKTESRYRRTLVRGLRPTPVLVTRMTSVERGLRAAREESTVQPGACEPLRVTVESGSYGTRCEVYGSASIETFSGETSSAVSRTSACELAALPETPRRPRSKSAHVWPNTNLMRTFQLASALANETREPSELVRTRGAGATPCLSRCLARSRRADSTPRAPLTSSLARSLGRWTLFATRSCRCRLGRERP
eukprot:Amastigsp_a511315_53.p2 type:complete len:203 gc:universal Amastigsp_a511315_53:830-222(-)